MSHGQTEGTNREMRGPGPFFNRIFEIGSERLSCSLLFEFLFFFPFRIWVWRDVNAVAIEILRNRWVTRLPKDKV